jgi:methionyl-tRNA formyltransferase
MAIGLLTTFWSLLYGHGDFGYTVHRILDSGIDTGDVIERKVLSTNPENSLFCHILEIYPLAANSLTRVVNSLKSGKELETTPQVNKGQGYYSYPKNEHFEQFLTKGYLLLNKPKYYELLNSFL